MPSLLQPTFSAGELAPSLYGRVDIAKYMAGLKTCRNFIVRQHGGVSNRPGTMFVAESHDSTKKSRLIKFQFSTVQTYVLEFTDQLMRIIKNGGLVVYPIGHGSAGQVVEVATPYLEADLFRLKFTQSADVITITHPSYITRQLSRTDHHVWTFTEYPNTGGPFLDGNLDQSIKVYTTGDIGTVNVKATANIFNSDMVGTLIRIEASEDSTTAKWEVGKSVTLNQIMRAGQHTYRCVAAGTTGTVTPTHTEGTETDGATVKWKYMHSGFGVGKITAYVSATEVTIRIEGNMPESLSTAATPKTISNVTPGDGLSTPVRITSTAHTLVDGNIITIADVDGTQCNGTWAVDQITVDTFDLYGCYDSTAYTGGGIFLKSTDAIPSWKWSIGAWSVDQGYPATVTYSQQRQIFGATPGQPQTMWMSRIAGYTDFGASIPLLDDDAINFTIFSREVNEIRHLVELSELLVLTSGGEWVCKGGQDGVLTPSTINVKRQGGNGCSHVPPIIVNNTCLYIQDRGNQIRSLGYNFANDAYVGGDLTVMSNHLFTGHTIVDWAYQQFPFTCIWMVRDDGKLLGLTYLQEQEVAAWHWHDTDGYFESVSCIPGTDEDEVYFVVRRTINGSSMRYIEKLAPRNFSSLEDAFFVDCGLTYDGSPADVISGLNHLEGKTVSILADGNVHPQRTVVGGSVTLDYDASKVHIGLPITADLEPLSLTISGANILDKCKLISKVSMMVESSRGIYIGPDTSHLYEYMPASTLATLQTETGIIEMLIDSTWDKNGTFIVRQTDPLPLSILSLIPDVSVGGT